MYSLFELANNQGRMGGTIKYMARWEPGPLD